MDTYDSAAAAGYAVLTKQYTQPEMFEGNFWFGGNALHVCLNYLLAAGLEDKEEILPAGFKVYKDLKDNPNWWKDDFGWWGNAFVYALSARNQLGYENRSHDRLFSDLREAAKSCWEQLWKNWSDTSYSAYNDNAVESVSDIPGGTFNNAPPPATPEKMSGRNSVTNESFWILSKSLAGWPSADPKYAAAAHQMEVWYDKWLKRKPPEGTGILNGLKLVLERPTGNSSAPQWYWSGDQGLFIQTQVGQPSNAVARDIAQSVVKNMTDKDNVLHENLDFTQYGLDEFLADYATGKGIFMRCLLSLVLGKPGKPYSDFIQRNASAVWSNRLEGNQFTFNWNGKRVPDKEPKILRVEDKQKKPDALCDLIMQAAGQGALNSALIIARDEPIQWPPSP